jgi:serine kinase of HPr protein (carbohydrate metabolism regulator)
VILHAGLIAAFQGGLWRGVLLEGPSGAGKSDLTLRALDRGFRLVADDRALIWPCDGALYGRAPDPLTGLLEVRGLGVEAEPPIPFCRIVLAVRCGVPERLPDSEFVDYCGLKIPQIVLAPLESSAPAKLSRALQHLGAETEGAYLSALALGVSPQPGGDSR